MNIIDGSGRPTDRTRADIGDIYIDSINGIRYRCVGRRSIVSDITTHYYIWVRVSINSQSATDSGKYIDQTTGLTYTLKVNNGKLIMEEV